MPRRYQPELREIEPDPRYNSELIAALINKVMTRGKKNTARGLVYDAMDIIQERTSKNPLDIVEQAMRNVSPTIEVKPRRVGGATYQIPMEVSPPRRRSLAIRWLVATARSRPGKGFADKLASELIDASQDTGP